MNNEEGEGLINNNAGTTTANNMQRDASMNMNEGSSSQAAQSSQNASPSGEHKREKRKVRDKTISYSLTHKGIAPTLDIHHQNNRSSAANQSNMYSGCARGMGDLHHTSSEYNSKNNYYQGAGINQGPGGFSSQRHHYSPSQGTQGQHSGKQKQCCSNGGGIQNQNGHACHSGGEGCHQSHLGNSCGPGLIKEFVYNNGEEEHELSGKRKHQYMSSVSADMIHLGGTSSAQPLDKVGMENAVSGSLKVDLRSHQKRQTGPKTSQQCLESIKDMFAFEWSLKEIANLKHNPCKSKYYKQSRKFAKSYHQLIENELNNSPMIFWFYICSQYFPFRALEFAKQPLEDFVEPILEKLKPNNKNILQNFSCEEFKQQETAHDLLINQSYSNQQLNDNQSAIIEDINQQKDAENLSVGSQPHKMQSICLHDHHHDELPDFIRTLFREKQMRRFKKLFKEELQQLKQNTSGEELQLEEISSPMVQLDEIIKKLSQEVENTSKENSELMIQQVTKFKDAYERALNGETKYEEFTGDSRVISGDTMSTFGLEFLAWVDPAFVKDLDTNLEWYLEHFRESPHLAQYNEILLNCSYPSRQEREFLKHVELAQQRKNDDKYLKILRQMEEQQKSGENGDGNSQGEEAKNGANNSAAQAASTRANAAQEDAQCVICNSGDYEDEDMIVFCGSCNIPVHQSCYGIEQLPEEDWICYNCTVFGLKRGLMVNCILCPKKGGAMKPTNILTPNHQSLRKQAQGVFGNINGGHSKRNPTQRKAISARQSMEPGQVTHLYQNQDSCMTQNQDISQELQSIETQGNDDFNFPLFPSAAATLGELSQSDRKSHLLEIIANNSEEKNLSIFTILRREQEYWAELFDIIDLQKKNPSPDRALHPAQELMQKIGQVELKFLPNERETQIPDDYCFFLQMNEGIIEQSTTKQGGCYVPTQYEWIHLSCATWIPGINVAPKAPIKLGKIDKARFQMQCIICLKKEGACMQCQSPRCTIAFHIECARRAGYCMEIEKRGDASLNPSASSAHLLTQGANGTGDTLGSNNKYYKVFCEKHRPLKLVKEMEERDLQTIEEIQRFCKIVDKCMDIDYKHQLKATAHKHQKKKEKERKEREKREALEKIREMEIEKRHMMKQSLIKARELKVKEAKDRKLSKQVRPPKLPKLPKLKYPTKAQMRELARKERDKVKRWREKDKKQLFERVKERYLQFRKLRLSLIRVDPYRKLRRQQALMHSQATCVSQRKRSQKRQAKQQQNQQMQSDQGNTSSCSRREGLRNKGQFTICIPSFEKLSQMQQERDMAEELSPSPNGGNGGANTEPILLDTSDHPMTEPQPHNDEESKQTQQMKNAAGNQQEESKMSQSCLNEDTFAVSAIGANNQIDNDNTHATVGAGIQHILAPDEGIYYKLGNPIHPSDGSIDWTITLSRNDFPWHEICFAPFTPKECFEKFTSIVKDPQTFLKKVLGLKEKYKKMMESQMQIMPGANLQSQTVQNENPAVYCRCKGSVVSELFVKCDGEQECPNGSWLHPQCTTDLCEKSKDELDSIEEWYCEDCIARIKREDDNLPEEEDQLDDEEPPELNQEDNDDIEEDENQEDDDQLDQSMNENQLMDEEGDIEINLDDEDVMLLGSQIQQDVIAASGINEGQRMSNSQQNNSSSVRILLNTVPNGNKDGEDEDMESSYDEDGSSDSNDEQQQDDSSIDSD